MTFRLSFWKICVNGSIVLCSQNIKTRNSSPHITSHDERICRTLQRKATHSGKCDFVRKHLMMLSRPNHCQTLCPLCRVFRPIQTSPYNTSPCHISSFKVRPLETRGLSRWRKKPGGAVDVPPSGQTRHRGGTKGRDGGQSAYWP